VPEGTSARDIVCVITKKRLTLKLKGALTAFCLCFEFRQIHCSSVAIARHACV